MLAVVVALGDRCAAGAASGGAAGGLIDELMAIQDADVVVGVFWKRFGTPTAAADSGTEHGVESDANQA